jgi:hypothetical protein
MLLAGVAFRQQFLDGIPCRGLDLSALKGISATIPVQEADITAVDRIGSCDSVPRLPTRQKKGRSERCGLR